MGVTRKPPAQRVLEVLFEFRVAEQSVLNLLELELQDPDAKGS
jgi:hypothetical protein